MRSVREVEGATGCVGSRRGYRPQVHGLPHPAAGCCTKAKRRLWRARAYAGTTVGHHSTWPLSTDTTTEEPGQGRPAVGGGDCDAVMSTTRPGPTRRFSHRLGAGKPD